MFNSTSLYSRDLPATPTVGQCDVFTDLTMTHQLFIMSVNVIYFLIYTRNDGQSPNSAKKVKSSLFTQ